MASKLMGLCSLLLILYIEVHSLPTGSKSSLSTQSKPLNSLQNGENIQISPENQPENVDLNEMVEIQEKDIPDGAWVLEVEEPIEQPKQPGELLETASNVAFRPLFRYRQKQGQRRISQANRRVRRRYYVPRRSYRQTNYYRPYRSYYNPYRRLYGVLA